MNVYLHVKETASLIALGYPNFIEETWKSSCQETGLAFNFLVQILLLAAAGFNVLCCPLNQLYHAL